MRRPLTGMLTQSDLSETDFLCLVIEIPSSFGCIRFWKVVAEKLRGGGPGYREKQSIRGSNGSSHGQPLRASSSQRQAQGPESPDIHQVWKQLVWIQRPVKYKTGCCPRTLHTKDGHNKRACLKSGRLVMTAVATPPGMPGPCTGVEALGLVLPSAPRPAFSLPLFLAALCSKPESVYW